MKGNDMNTLVKTALAAGYVGTILAANYVTSRFGMVPVGFGLLATAGTYFVGVTFILRDAVQDTSGKRVTFALIALGAILSFVISDPFIALASAVAFAASETADFLIYTPLRKRGYVRAAVASNVVGAVADTILFLSVAGFPLSATPGQIVGKITVTLGVVFLVAYVRAARRIAGAA